MHKVEFDFVKDGPIVVKKDGNVEFALCRCGHSAKKPFCDGGHHKAAFQAPASKSEIV